MLVDERYAEALALAEGVDAAPSAIERLAKATSPEAARWAFGQWELRRRAQAKFTNAHQMLFVREALEQATHERVASYHASLFPVGARVADLTVGIGADLLALARRGPAFGFELDSERAEYARHNLTAHGLEAEVRVEDSLRWLRSNEAATVDYAFADPARRVEGRRTLRLDEFSPNPREIAQAFAGLRLGVMKLSPMLTDEALRSLGPRIEFVSFDGECREALVAAGHEAASGVAAVHLESGERIPETLLPPMEGEPRPYLFDADPAAVRAHALGALCERYGLAPLGDSNGYLTGDHPVSSPWLRGYRVLYRGKADPKATRRALRELGAGTPELKQRGAGLDLVRERKAYALEGSRRVSLAIWPLGRSLRHTVLEAADRVQ